MPTRTESVGSRCPQCPLAGTGTRPDLHRRIKQVFDPANRLNPAWVLLDDVG
ncbi:FAD-linked oxidase C-terminal domain-containing protein [Kribbella catacumbae]|uniref:FAD-linked oxidase C-terminal domain-containing protein n=1 Tax=Kribbella catacumbae TaxID=460086 RepID=UPI0012FC5F38